MNLTMMMTQMEKMNKQVGGTHYSQFKYQPVHLMAIFGFNWFEGEILKYVSRYPYKNGLQDLKKAISVLDIYESLYPKPSNSNYPWLNDPSIFGIDLPRSSSLIRRAYVLQFSPNHGISVDICIKSLLSGNYRILRNTLEHLIESYDETEDPINRW